MTDSHATLIAEIADLREQLRQVTRERDEAARHAVLIGDAMSKRVRELEALNRALAERCAGQSELLSRRAEVQPVDGWG